MTLRPALAAVLLAALLASALAQQPARRAPPERRQEQRQEQRQEPRQDEQKKDEKKEAPSPDEALAQYEPAMLRLAETLGALAFLRDLCGPGDSAQWRARMQELLDGEGQNENRRARLAGAFNRGFHGYATVYRGCTPNAELALARRLAEGRRLARDLAARWGG